MDGAEVGPTLPQQIGDIPVIGERILLVLRPALFARPQLADVDQRAEDAALAFPAADRE